MICRICGKEKEKRNQMHGHFMQCHRAEYQAAKYNLDRLVDGITPRIRELPQNEERRKSSQLPRPDGFRLLTKTNEAESRAIINGFVYIDAYENLFTTTDAKAEGWI